jgi:mono/diheme cytochrome c family protein
MKCVLRLCAAIALIAVAHSPLLVAAADLRMGKQTYDAYCAGCHGIGGNGEGPSAKWVKPLPRDFTQCKLMAMYKDADLLKAIKDGGPAAFVSYSMPPWGAVLSDGQIDDVLAYERSFCAKK